MTALESAIRAVLANAGADPEGWRDMLALIRPGVAALLEHLPPDLAAKLRPYMET